jgi:8-hydroxy-5-deazaflavin:NADPH oxidoreductase
MTTIAFIGSGPVAQNLATLARAAGHETIVSSRTPNPALETLSYAQAAEQGDIIVLAIPYRAAAETVAKLVNQFANKIVIDATNPLNEDYTPINLGADTSAGQEIAALLPHARIVKAFNTIFANVMQANHQNRAGLPATAFIATDHAEAHTTVANLASEMGFAPIRTGPLNTAKYLEAMAHLNIQIAFRENGGPNAAFVYHQVQD